MMQTMSLRALTTCYNYADLNVVIGHPDAYVYGLQLVGMLLSAIYSVKIFV